MKKSKMREMITGVERKIEASFFFLGLEEDVRKNEDVGSYEISKEGKGRKTRVIDMNDKWLLII
jgi:hypothetical protein